MPAAPPDDDITQVAIVPLDLIGAEDLGLGAAQFDAWLRSISGDLVTLERIKNVAGALPAVGNIMALIDALNDIVTLVERKTNDPLDWVSLGINLIGIPPLPPTMAAARMSLRPTLFLVRQQGGQLIGDALIETLIGHLNADIAGTLDDFVEQARGKLGGLLDEAGQYGENIVLEIANGLEALVSASLNAQGDLDAASKQIHAAGDQLLYDPKAAFSNIFSAAYSAYKAAGKSVANKAVRHFVSDDVRNLVGREVGALRALAPQVREQISRQGDENVEHSIGNLLVVLNTAVVLWRARQTRGQSVFIKPERVSQAKRQAGQGKLEVVRTEKAAKKDADPQKNLVCPSTCHSISFATGSESLSHTDFSLPGPFPIEWTRTYHSGLSAYDQGVLGARWVTPFTTRIDQTSDGLRYHAEDGRSHDFSLPALGKLQHDAVENLTLVRHDAEHLVLCHGFDRRDTYVRQGNVYRLASIVLRSGAGVMLHYEHRYAEQPMLSDLVTFQDDPSQTHLHLRTLLDEQGRVLGLWEIRDGVPLRQLCGYQYDPEGDLIQARDEHDATWNYQYRKHLITRYTDRTGRAMNLQWQGQKAIREWTDDGSFDTRLKWHPTIRLTTVTDALGQQTRHYYDALGYTYRIAHPDGHSEWIFRDQAKNPIRHVHPDGSTDRYAYDDLGNLLEHIRADATVVQYAYDPKGQLSKISDAEGGQWQRDYDQRGYLTESVDPLGHKTEYAYTVDGNVSAITDAHGNQKKLAYNAAGQLTRYADCSGKVSVWDYNAAGQKTRFTDALGHSTHYDYQAGNLARIQHPDKTEEHFEYDAEGRLLSHVDDLQRRTTWTYSEAGLLAERTDAAKQTLRYRWDRLGQLLSLENQNRQQAHFRYDAMGRLLQESGFDQRITRYHYDELTGRLASTHDGDRTIALDFDPMGRLIERRAQLGHQSQSETFAHDGHGNLAMAINKHSRLQWFRDAAGNLQREHQHYLGTDQPMVAVWQHEYDALNQRIATTRPDGHRVSWLTYGSGHLLSLKLDQHELLSYERDALHRETVRHQGNQLKQNQVWDPLGRLQEQHLVARNGQTLLIKRQYRYDSASQLIHLDDNRRGPLAYHYDPVGRLLKAMRRDSSETFAFDPASNLLDQRPPTRAQASSRLDNLLRDYAGTHYQYDERGNLIESLHNGQRSRLRWDLFDRLEYFEDQRLSVSYQYDALGRRLTKESNAHYRPDPQSGDYWNKTENLRRQRELNCGPTLYGWDGDQLAWESNPQNPDGAAGRTVHYLYEPDSFIPVAQAVRNMPIRLLKQPNYRNEYRQNEDPLWTHVANVEPIDSLHWYHCDHLGTPQELSDQNGDIVWRGHYNAWGEIQQERTATAYNPLRFQGQYHDPETGLHYNRYRYYDPRVGRFISKDPIGYAGGLNLYQYAPNPVEWVDPLGLMGYRAVDRVGPSLVFSKVLTEKEAVRRVKKGKDVHADSRKEAIALGKKCACKKVMKHEAHADVSTGNTVGRLPHIHPNNHEGLAGKSHIFFPEK